MSTLYYYLTCRGSRCYADALGLSFGSSHEGSYDILGKSSSSEASFATLNAPKHEDSCSMHFLVCMQNPAGRWESGIWNPRVPPVGGWGNGCKPPTKAYYMIYAASS
eukprot:scaffold7003_cov106-Skeletonema_dohrnii-CCMP3373.AAC.8